MATTTVKKKSKTQSTALAKVGSPVKDQQKDNTPKPEKQRKVRIIGSGVGQMTLNALVKSLEKVENDTDASQLVISKILMFIAEQPNGGIRATAVPTHKLNAGKAKLDKAIKDHPDGMTLEQLHKLVDHYDTVAKTFRFLLHNVAKYGWGIQVVRMPAEGQPIYLTIIRAQSNNQVAELRRNSVVIQQQQARVALVSGTGDYGDESGEDDQPTPETTPVVEDIPATETTPDEQELVTA